MAIMLKSDNKKTLVTIVNYDAYQGDIGIEWTPKEHQSNIKRTSKEHQSNTDKNIRTKESKEVKKVESDPVLNQWNSFAKENGLSEITAISPKRKAGVIARAKEPTFDLPKIFERISTSPFLLGQSSDWRVDFDFVFCSSNNYLKILEGKYSGTHQQSNRTGARQVPTRESVERSVAAAQRSIDARNRDNNNRT
jgi:hypothetical protein